jgi:RimJ/RimL family protein N-acetyltransferase
VNQRGVVSIEPWKAEDRPLLDALLGVPEMMVYLGGPETQEKLDERQARYVNNPRSLRISVDGEGVGWVGYWDHEEADGSLAWETGWSVRREFQGRGIATAALRLAFELMRRDGDRRYVHATTTVDNAPSNALCRKLGFELMGQIDYEYPAGNPVHGNDWRFDLRAAES